MEFRYVTENRRGNQEETIQRYCHYWPQDTERRQIKQKIQVHNAISN